MDHSSKSTLPSIAVLASGAFYRYAYFKFSQKLSCCAVWGFFEGENLFLKGITRLRPIAWYHRSLEILYHQPVTSANLRQILCGSASWFTCDKTSLLLLVKAVAIHPSFFSTKLNVSSTLISPSILWGGVRTKSEKRMTAERAVASLHLSATAACRAYV